MKSIIFILISFMFVGCVACTKKPTPIMHKNKKGKTVMAEPIECYYYRECQYYSTIDTKGGDSCKAEFIKCCKALDYRYCTQDENRHKDSNFNDCFKMLQ